MSIAWAIFVYTFFKIKKKMLSNQGQAGMRNAYKIKFGNPMRTDHFVVDLGVDRTII
jgi:hypothetical protein